MKGHRRFRSGAWRLVVHAGTDPVSGRRIDIHETVRAPNNRAGAKQADARLAELIAAVERGEDIPRRRRQDDRVTFAEVAERWARAHRPRQNERTGEWIGWSPKTAKTHEDNFRLYLLPALGHLAADAVTGVRLDDLYFELEQERGLSPAVVVRCHSQVRAMYNWALRKKLVEANPALSADPPRIKPGRLEVPDMADIRRVIDVATPAFGVYVHLAATVGARRGTLLALRWSNVDLEKGRITFERAIAESSDGVVEKGTKADRPYVVTIGPGSVRVLTEHRRRAIEVALSVGHDFGPRSFVFSEDGGATHRDPSWPTQAWLRYCHRLDIANVRLHDLRHTAASQMLMAGIPISIVAERLGCTEANVLRTYRHFIPGSDLEAALLMDAMLEGEALPARATS